MHPGRSAAPPRVYVTVVDEAGDEQLAHRLETEEVLDPAKEIFALLSGLVKGFAPRSLVVDPGGGVVFLNGDEVMRWRNGAVQTVVGRGTLNGPQDLAVGAGGDLYVADTGNGRVVRVSADGAIDPVIGLRAAGDCLARGLDAPLALDARACVGVKALAVDDRGDLYLAVRGVALILGVTPDGKMGVVAGTGPAGWRVGDGRADHVRLGEIGALRIGPDGDLYVGEGSPIGRVRRIVDPRGLLVRATS